MNCEIQIKDNNVKVKTFPDLWDEINANIKNQRNARGVYAYAVSDEFLELGIKNPTFKQLMSFIDLQKSNAAPLTLKEKRFLLNFSVNRSSASIVDAFTTRDGVFGYDVKSLSPYFSKSEISMLLNRKPKEIESIYYKFKDSEEMLDMRTVNDVVRQDGIFEIENPDITKEFLEQSFAGMQTVDEVQAAAVEMGYDITEAEVEYVLKNLRDKKIIPVFNADGTAKVYNSTKDVLEQTYQVGQDSREILNTIGTLLDVSPITWVEDSTLIEDILIELEQQAQDIGLDLSEISSTYEYRSPEEFSAFLEATETFIRDAQNTELTQEQVEVYSEMYDVFFSDFSFEKGEVFEKTSNTEFMIDERISEEEAFDRFGAVRIRDRVYQKVPNMEYDALIEEINRRDLPFITTENQPYNTQERLKEIDKHLTIAAKKHATPNASFETLQKIEAYKAIYGIENVPEDLNFPEKIVVPRNVEQKVYKEMLENPILFEHLGFSSQGIELLTRGEYTKKLLELELKSFKDLQDYAVVTGINSLRGLIPNVETPQRREYLVNNPHKLEQFESDYKKPTPTTVVTLNDTADFINIESEIYEKVGPLQYELVAPYSNDIQIGLEKPEAKLDNPSQYFVQDVGSITVKKGPIDSLRC